MDNLPRMDKPPVAGDPSLGVPPRLLSPGIQTDTCEPAWRAFELKFLIDAHTARAVQSWAREHLEVDPYGDLRTGMYQTTTLYLDTPAFDVLQRTPGFRRRKFRVRRYGEEGQIHLERKTRSKDQVKKRRFTVPHHELQRLSQLEAHHGWAGDWFHQRLLRRELRPACRMTYHRAAFMKQSLAGVVRLTLDHHIRGVVANDWGLDAVHEADELLPGQVVCELKFRDTMPALFKQLVTDLRLTPGSVSKYRRMMQNAGFVVNAPNDANPETATTDGAATESDTESR
jgi:hypothetical protein